MPLIVGNPADIHVQAVVGMCDVEPIIVDAATILESPVTIGSDVLVVHDAEVPPGPGWLRRLAPEGWTKIISGPGTEAVSRSAAVAALAAIARDQRFAWLTDLDHLGSAENKPHQYRCASAAGVPIPVWLVTTDTGAIPQDGAWIAKPLGPGSFIDDEGHGRVVPTRRVDTTDRATIARVPFILQHLVQARAHARVVTVGTSVWSAILPAEDLPLDWRTSPAAHSGFTPTPVPEHVHELAVTAARSTCVGYSAQDWIQDTDGTWWFIDLNPAGQWLFLPDEVARSVTAAIARHLSAAQ